MVNCLFYGMGHIKQKFQKCRRTIQHELGGLQASARGLRAPERMSLIELAEMVKRQVAGEKSGD